MELRLFRNVTRCLWELGDQFVPGVVDRSELKVQLERRSLVELELCPYDLRQTLTVCNDDDRIAAEQIPRAVNK
jgi:hypothetical protein